MAECAENSRFRISFDFLLSVLLLRELGVNVRGISHDDGGFFTRAYLRKNRQKYKHLAISDKQRMFLYRHIAKAVAQKPKHETHLWKNN